MILSLLVNPLASLIALMHASVPEFTNLILSIAGTIDKDSLATWVSSLVGIPNEVPFFAVKEIASTIFGFACPSIIAPHEDI